VSDHNVSDTDKICMQLFLDIQVNFICMAILDFCLLVCMNHGSLGSKPQTSEMTYTSFLYKYFHQEYGRNLSALGVEAANILAYRSLWQCVAPPDRQNKITF
jgi:hypothetical protein